MILTTLKDQTRHLHEQIEKTVDLEARLGSVDGYVGLLARFHGFYAPIEARLVAIDGYGAIGLDLTQRLKAALLSADLRALGLSQAEVEALPRCARLPSVPGIAEALGCLYVLEGATLGGQIVKRMVASRLGLAPGRGCSFFGSYGEDVGLMWKDFRAILGQYAAQHPGAEKRVVAAAADTFNELNAWVAGAPTS